MSRLRRPGPSRRVRVREFKDATFRNHEDRLTTEEPLEIRLGWPGVPADRLSVTMRTPGHDFELAAGFLYAEGLVSSASDLHTVAYCTDHTLSAEEEFNVVTAELSCPPGRPVSRRYDGPGAGSSACGVCGKESIDEVIRVAAGRSVSDRWGELCVHPKVLTDLPGSLRAAQHVFSSTGGLHAAGLFTEDGEALVIREDVGRHNAVDKVVGSRLLADQDTAAPILCVSGRIGFELVQKAIVAGVGVMAAVGAPSGLAVELADRAGLCTLGFLREDRFVVYTAPERVGV